MPSLARHTYSPASAGDAWKMYRREPRTWAAVSKMVSGVYPKIQLMLCLWFSQLGMPVPQFRGQDLYASAYMPICLTVSIGFGSGWPLPTLLPPHIYLVPGRETASTPVPCDLGMGLPSHHTVEVQGVSLSHSRGGGLNSDRCGRPRGCKQKDRAGTCSYSPENGISTTFPLAQPCLLRLGSHIKASGTLSLTA